MTLPDISTRLECKIDRFELFDVDGTTSCAVVLKQRFEWNERGALRRVEGAKVEYVDVPWPDAESTMIPSDLCLRKPSTDVVVAGHAVSDRAVPAIDVHVAVGPVSRSLRVFGTRVWYAASLGMKPSEAVPFERLPLMWEHAFGGSDVSDPSNAISEDRNPCGHGLAANPKTLEGEPVPQIEDPTDPIQNAHSRPKPAGLAACPPHFEPRRTYAGTFDQRWQDERSPLFPLDFDERFHQVAVPELVTPEPLRGHEPVQLLNLGRPGAVRFELPRLVFEVEAHTDSGVTQSRPVLDTVVLLPDDRQVDLVYRTSVPVRRRSGRVRELRIYEKRVIGR